MYLTGYTIISGSSSSLKKNSESPGPKELDAMMEVFLRYGISCSIFCHVYIFSMIRHLEMRILVGATNKTAVVSTKYWWLARYVLLAPLFLLNTFQVFQCPNLSIKSFFS